MKPFHIIALFASLSFFSCRSGEKNKESEKSVTKEKLEDLYGSDQADAPKINPKLVGKWQVDSSGFMDNNIQTPLEAPLADAFWEFTPEGKLIISGNANFTSDLAFTGNSFKMNMSGVDMTYEIKSLTENSLVLYSTIVDTKDLKMVSVAKLSKRK